MYSRIDILKKKTLLVREYNYFYENLNVLEDILKKITLGTLV